ncbi:MAG: hypothetical protein GKR88_02145 [Flavobacteriaceae bacterium]|nr:MAG: hypothetical protein GKR88_02145 [Flavobacteriaceae bacterium]
MSKKEKSKRFEFINENLIDGPCLYQGIPYTTDETIDIIGKKGIEKIDNEIKKMVKWKNKIYKQRNPDLKGLAFTLSFADFFSQRVIEITGEFPEKPSRYIEMHSGLKEFNIPKNLRKNNFELLKRTNYYLIKVSATILPDRFVEYLAKKV